MSGILCAGQEGTRKYDGETGDDRAYGLETAAMTRIDERQLEVAGMRVQNAFYGSDKDKIRNEHIGGIYKVNMFGQVRQSNAEVRSMWGVR